MTPKKSTLPDGMQYISVYVAKELLSDFDSMLEGRDRSVVLRALMKGYVEGEFKVKEW